MNQTEVMSADKDEALRLAETLETRHAANPLLYDTDWPAAALLRSQHAEIERLRADAARYRRLRDVGSAAWRANTGRIDYSADDADRQIDAEIAADAGQAAEGAKT